MVGVLCISIKIKFVFVVIEFEQLFCQYVNIEFMFWLKIKASFLFGTDNFSSIKPKFDDQFFVDLRVLYK